MNKKKKKGGYQHEKYIYDFLGLENEKKWKNGKIKKEIELFKDKGKMVMNVQGEEGIYKQNKKINVKK